MPLKWEPLGLGQCPILGSTAARGLLSELRHQADFHGGESLRDRALRFGRLSDLLECGGVHAGNLAFGFERNAGDRETSRNRAEIDGSFLSVRGPSGTAPPIEPSRN